MKRRIQNITRLKLKKLFSHLTKSEYRQVVGYLQIRRLNIEGSIKMILQVFNEVLFSHVCKKIGLTELNIRCSMKLVNSSYIVRVMNAVHFILDTHINYP